MVVVVGFAVAGCEDVARREPCEALHTKVERGIVLAEDPEECAKILAFSEGPQVAAWPSFEAWLDEVAGQRVDFMFDAVLELVEGTGWAPASFGPEPAAVPCGGVPVDDALWASLEVSAIWRERPSELHVASMITIEHAADAQGWRGVRIESVQDFDCDGVTASSVTEGRFVRGGYVIHNWQVSRTSFAPLYE